MSHLPLPKRLLPISFLKLNWHRKSFNKPWRTVH